MTAAYSVDLRERVVQLKLKGQHTNQQIADIFMIGVSSVKKYFRKYKNDGDLTPQKPGGRKPTIGSAEKELLKSYIELSPDATLGQYRDQLEKDTGKDVTVPCIHYIIKELEISYKKKPVCSRTRS